jgi:hypothetical protein
VPAALRANCDHNWPDDAGRLDPTPFVWHARPAVAGCALIDPRQRLGESAGTPKRPPYLKTIHKAAPAVAVMATDITIDSATSFAQSQYDTHAISGRLHRRAASVPGNTGKR